MKSLTNSTGDFKGGFILTDNEYGVDRVRIYESEGKIFMRDLELDEEFDGVENVLTELRTFKTLEEVLGTGVEMGYFIVGDSGVIFDWELEGEMFDWLRGEGVD